MDCACTKHLKSCRNVPDEQISDALPTCEGQHDSTDEYLDGPVHANKCLEGFSIGFVHTGNV